MNPTTTIETKDPFRAAYLLRYGKYKETLRRDKGAVYVIEGDKLSEEDFKYRTGFAFINPLLFKEAYKLLLELSRKNQVALEEIDLFAVADDDDNSIDSESETEDEIELLSENEEDLS